MKNSMKEIKIIAEIKKAIILHPLDKISKTTMSSDGRKVLVEYDGSGHLRACCGELESPWTTSPREVRQWILNQGLSVPMKTIRIY